MPTRAELHARGTRLSWFWVLLGILLGAPLIASLTAVVADEPPRPDVALLVGTLTFALVGILVGYHSPGRTIREPGVSGVVLAIAGALTFGTLLDARLSPTWYAIVLCGGPVLAVVGGWAGEMLQGTLEREGRPEGIEWGWIGVGTLLGVMLSCYSVFVLNAIFEPAPLYVLLAFVDSLFLTALFVGYFSPGVTILEPALAAMLVIAVDFLLGTLGFHAPFPLAAVLIAAVGAFFVALLGGYLGEVAHNLRWRSAWGEAPGSYTEAPKPG